MASVIERLKQHLKNDYGISKREFEVLILRISGHSIAECADKLFISSYTVKQHIRLIYMKLGLSCLKKQNNVSSIVVLIAKKYGIVIKPPQQLGELPLGDMNCNYKYKKGNA